MKFESSICRIFDVFLENSLNTTGVNHNVGLSRSHSEVLAEIQPFASFVACVHFIKSKRGKRAFPFSLMELLGELS